MMFSNEHSRSQSEVTFGNMTHDIKFNVDCLLYPVTSITATHCTWRKCWWKSHTRSSACFPIMRPSECFQMIAGWGFPLAEHRAIIDDCFSTRWICIDRGPSETLRSHRFIISLLRVLQLITMIFHTYYLLLNRTRRREVQNTAWK